MLKLQLNRDQVKARSPLACATCKIPFVIDAEGQHKGSGERVLIRTFPPNSNANYGGVLQAWALQRTLISLGHEADVDSTMTGEIVTWKMRFRHSLRNVMIRLIPPWFVPRSLWAFVYRDVIRAPVLEFSAAEISTVPLHLASGQVDPARLDDYTAFVVGSDQVWRPQYVDVCSYLLDFVPSDFSGPRVAYAASFGTAKPIFTSALIETTAPLARKFTDVSVREESGRRLCRELWGIEAERVVDPTLLIPESAYLSLAEKADVPPALDGLVSYLLDPHGDLAASARSVASELGAPFIEVQSQPGRRTRQGWSVSSVAQRMSVYEWLLHFSTARYVVTDSFHGCVFAVIFRKQFVVVPNEARGRARFETFLGDLGLEGRSVESLENIRRTLEEPIEWVSVEQRLSELRDASIQFLTRSLHRGDLGSG